jgi:hypothetical protein
MAPAITPRKRRPQEIHQPCGNSATKNTYVNDTVGSASLIPITGNAPFVDSSNANLILGKAALGTNPLSVFRWFWRKRPSQAKPR